MIVVRLLCLLALVAAAAAPARAADAPGTKGLRDAPPVSERGAAPATPDPETMLAAVVRVRMKAVADARSNANLGPQREGSGVVIDASGHVLTIGYIVIEADSIEIEARGRTVAATLVGYDHASGFGLLRATSALGLQPMPLGQASDLEVREPVMVLPAGGRETAHLAYVVSKRRFTGSWEYLLESAIFTSPPTMQWAGAALVNREGRLVGIGSLLVRDTAGRGTAMPGNMFVPVDLLKPILADLIARGRRNEPPRPWLGVSTEELHGRLMVTQVSPEGPAQRAGIAPGDLILGVAGTTVSTHEQFYRKVWGLGTAGMDVPVRLLQGAEVRELMVRSMDRFSYFRGKPPH